MKNNNKEKHNAYMREYNRRMRPVLKERGICVACKSRPANKGFTCCEKCALTKRLNLKFMSSPKYIPIYKKFFNDQKGKCAICGIKTNKLKIDHDHKFTVLRGLLCNACNCGLGMFKDNKKNLRKSLKYLS
jgi:hypothetical protein